MNYYYITGTASGIGQELALQLLQNPSNKVTGISRNNNISHSNFTFYQLDLSDINAVCNFKFQAHSDADKICLVNNAGTLGEVKHIGKLNAKAIAENYQVNLVAPSILINVFISFYNSSSAEKVILNVSSGAGKSPIDGWAAYCASKAAIDMYSCVAAEEQKMDVSDKKQAVKIFSVAPGKVDTAMQAAIRVADKNDFSKVQDFVRFKKDNQLLSPQVVAEKYIKLLENADEPDGTVFSLKDIDLK
jgi:benzil reductase ((S)-benzoin forming)